MELVRPWNNEQCATFIISLEGEIANLLFMLLKDRYINKINQAIDSFGSISEETKGKVIIKFHSLLKARIIKPEKGKNWVKGYLEKTFDEVDFIDDLFADYPLADVSANAVQTEMDILTDTVVKHLKSRSFMKNIDTLRAELVELIVNYPVDAAMVLIFLLSEKK